ncbi:DUF3712 domain-containing protein [Aspergillus brunneoviolaceus CBS 621.78]|uniref:Uncharacterized protein n=1 Tax=Aspergillus brunneoviolaceus CBS 621.78 TaxID=1450534 RepID=A0ACD1FUL5_9EURO|nr:hypothetical protein BO95DRAFT_436487 [Aspergillus brunneoviolaceus CBS 621.78]RAH40654.1 hypothetical protein BO95DRAFT_436487 [Aspergillus brunneoviolaceus CBS 621.78]
MATNPSSLDSDDAKYALGTHRGPLPSEGVDNEHLEKTRSISLEPGKRTRAQRLRRHWGRFWCCYVFGSIIFLTIFLPIFFLVILPAIAQRVVDGSTLVLVHADVLQPRPDSMMLRIDSALNLPLKIPVRIDPITMDLFNRDRPENNTWGKAYLPSARIYGNTTLATSSTLTALNVTEWTEYVRSVVYESHAPLSVRGSTTAYIGKLKSHVTMNKDIHQTSMWPLRHAMEDYRLITHDRGDIALNSFKGFSISDPQLLLRAHDDGTNLLANATLPNPSAMTLEIGTTTLNLYSNTLLVGNVTLDNLTLTPGNHSTPVRGVFDLGKVITNLGRVLRDQRAAIKRGYLDLTTVGTDVTYDGVQVPYYTEVMRNLTMTAQVPLGKLVENTLRGVLVRNGTNLLAGLNLTTVPAAAVTKIQAQRCDVTRTVATRPSPPEVVRPQDPRKSVMRAPRPKPGGDDVHRL